MTVFSGPLRVLDDWVNEGVVRGASASVWHRGEIVATHAAGIARANERVTTETMFALASVSKPFTAAAVMWMVDQDLIALDAPVAAVLPEFGEVDDPLSDDVVPQLEALRDRVTVRQLLCHTSGVPENIGVKRIQMRSLPTLDQLVDAMCGVPLVSPPGAVLRYSNVGPGVASRVAERAAGIGIHEIIQSNILDPLYITGVALRPDDSWDSRLAYIDDAPSVGKEWESYNTTYWRQLGIPWGGYFCTPSAVARFAASFFPGVSSPLSGESKVAMTTDQTDGVDGGIESMRITWTPGSWAAGWEVAADKKRHWTGSLRSPRTFCHWGQAGTLVWADPDRELVLAVFGNRSIQSRWPFSPARWAPLSDAVVAAADSLSQ